MQCIKQAANSWFTNFLIYFCLPVKVEERETRYKLKGCIHWPSYAEGIRKIIRSLQSKSILENIIILIPDFTDISFVENEHKLVCYLSLWQNNNKNYIFQYINTLGNVAWDRALTYALVLSVQNWYQNPILHVWSYNINNQIIKS